MMDGADVGDAAARVLSKRKAWKVWFAILAVLVGISALPVSNTLTRAGSVVALLVGWGLLTTILWRHRWVRATLLMIPAACAAFLILPSRTHEGPQMLRHDFIACLRHYEGVRYFWGDEGFTGIDCSGLVRRGLIDSMFMRGIRTLDAGSVRYAIWLWWNDCSARDLGEGRNDLTVPVLETPSINDLDHSRVTPGDLAVTKGGEHVMAYVGDNVWIEADPLAHRVIIVRAPSRNNAWFHGPMTIVRWRILSQ
jgi:hypothetical protein